MSLSSLFINTTAEATCMEHGHEVTTHLIPMDGFGIFQLIFMILVYGFILSWASNLIADGSEQLLLVLDPGIVGGVVLPVMGAVPDGAIVLFSGLGPDAAEQLSVGVGTLAGSTAMLLTIPWSLCTFIGRVDISSSGKANYRPRKGEPKLSKGWSLTETGVGADFKVIRPNILIMVGTVVTYILIQAPSFAYQADKDAAKEESGWALAGFILAFVLFVAYSVYQVFGEAALSEQQAKKDQRLRDIAKAGGVGIEALLSDAAFRQGVAESASGSDLRQSLTTASHSVDGKLPETDQKNLDTFIGALFEHVSGLVEKDNLVDEREAEILIRTMVGRRAFLKMHLSMGSLVRQYGNEMDGHCKMDQDQFKRMFLDIFAQHADSIAEQRSCGNQMQTVLYSLFPCCNTRNTRAAELKVARSARGSVSINAGSRYGAGGASAGMEGHVLDKLHEEASHGLEEEEAGGEIEMVEDDDDEEEGEDDEEEEEEDEGEETAGMSRGTILFKALSTMLAGVIVVTIFSDPIVDVLSNVGNRIGVKPFYVSFIVTPVVSNASEFISSVIFASKRTKKSITMTFSALLGAASMNNTFCLCIFLALVWAKKLAWTFSAEVTSIVFIEVAVAALVYRPVHRLWTAIVILSLFPLSILLVWILENLVGWD